MAFVLDDAVASIEAVQGTTISEAQLLGEVEALAPHVTTTNSSSGVNETLHVVFVDPDAPDGYFKPHDGLDALAVHRQGQDTDTPPVHECAAWQLARRLGAPYDALVVPTVYRTIDERRGSISQHRDGGPNFATVLAKAAEQAKAAGFFDALIGQQDRHDLQHRWDGSRLHLIDHGFCFPTRFDRHRQTSFWDFRVAASRTLTSEEAEALTTLLDSDDLLGIAPMLDERRADHFVERAREMLTTGTLLLPKKI